jgi:hypothetical protein
LRRNGKIAKTRKKWHVWTESKQNVSKKNAWQGMVQDRQDLDSQEMVFLLPQGGNTDLWSQQYHQIYPRSSMTHTASDQEHLFLQFPLH